MGLSRRTGQRFQANIWPGFVDAMTGLLLVLMFVLTIFMVVQFVLRETITGQETQLDSLSGEIAALAQALGLEQRKTAALRNDLGALNATLEDRDARLDEQESLISALTATRERQAEELAAAAGRIASFEEQVAGLLAERDGARGQVAALEGEREELLSAQEALNAALASARGEMDAQAEAARLAAARREALEALVADLRAQNSTATDRVGALSTQVEDLSAALSEEEAQRLAEAEAAAALRARLESASGELTAMTMALEQERARAEETLTLLAAARAAEDDLNARLAAALVEGQQAGELRAQLDAALAAQSGAQATAEEVRAQLTAALAAQRAAELTAEDALTRAETQAALLATARGELDTQSERASAATRQTEALNQQLAALRRQLEGLQGLLDESRANDAAAQVQLQSLGSDLNAALARVAAEERKRRQLEEAERKRLEAQAQDLQRYRSEFFGRLRDVLGNQEGIRIEGDRFVFSSEVLFPLGEAELSAQGRAEVAKVANILRAVADDIPAGIDWIIRVDGHTDDVPVRPGAQFADNWELSQARALSVVKYMIDGLGIAPDRLAANGFGQYSPINPDDTPEARAQNRRIELKFTEK